MHRFLCRELVEQICFRPKLTRPTCRYNGYLLQSEGKLNLLYEVFIGMGLGDKDL